MTLVLELPAELETELRAAANARGVGVETLAFERLRSNACGQTLQTPRDLVNRLRGQAKGSSPTVDEFLVERSAEENTTPQNPLARALALVDERDAKVQNVTPRVLGINDAATEIRAMREAQTP